jgi:indole-3-acetate monooxygenase
MSLPADDAHPLVRAARDLAPGIVAVADRIERERQLPAELVRALVDAGLFRMLLPRTVGGAETDLITYCRAVESIARADGSTAWCIAQASGCSLVAALLDPDVAWEIFGRDPRSILAWGPPTSRATATAVDAGYQVTGQWSFASGCHHATWLGAQCEVCTADGRPVLDDKGRPDVVTFIFPATQGRLLDVWDVSGLRGTGSDSYEVEGLFIPERLQVRRDDLTARREPDPLYAFRSSSVYPIGFASVAIGIARGALDAFAELAGAKTPRGARSVLRENAVVQSQVAQAEASLRAGRAFLHETVREAWDHATRCGEITLEQRVLIRLATTHAIHLAAGALDVAYHQAGATAIFSSKPFERRFRDVHAVTQQVQGRQAHYETVGKFFLGLEPDASWL